MFESILSTLGLGGKRKATVTTVRLDIIAEQVKEFNEAKKQINQKIDTLEVKTSELDHVITETRDLTQENKERLDNIEASLKRMVEISESVLTNKLPAGKAAEPGKGEKPAK